MKLRQIIPFLPLGWHAQRDSTQRVGSSFTHKYKTRDGSGKPSSLLWYGINYGLKKCYSTGPRGMVFINSSLSLYTSMEIMAKRNLTSKTHLHKIVSVSQQLKYTKFQPY
jgi:hypothetical protein